MAVDKIVQARRRGMFQSCATQLVALPIAVGFLGVVLVIANGTPSGTSPLLVAAVVLGLVFMVFVLPLAVIGFAVIRIRGSRLDRAFGALGPGTQVSLVGRGWQGEVAGRQINAWFSRGPQLEIYVAGDTGAVAGVGQDNSILRLATNLSGKTLVEVEGGFSAGGPDLDWTRQWLAAPGVKEAVAVLLEEDERSLRSVSVQPDSLRFVARYLATAAITSDAVTRWTEAATTCVAAAEAIGPPAERQEPGFGSGLRTYRGGLWMGCVVVAGTLGVLAAIVGFVGIILAFTGA